MLRKQKRKGKLWALYDGGKKTVKHGSLRWHPGGGAEGGLQFLTRQPRYEKARQLAA
jgi:hypothetical protein